MYPVLRIAMLGLALCGSLLHAPSGRADNAPPAPSKEVQQRMQQFEASLQWQQGKIDLKGGLAELDVPKEFLYLNPADSARILKVWGNGQVDDTLGMLFPANTSIFSEDAWGVIITYSDEGHVRDDDAKSVDYDKLLKEMQEQVLASNDARKQRGARQVEYVGWASPPRYDSAQHKLYWAKELHFEGSTSPTLNYNIRILGKEGVLVLNAVAEMRQLPMIEANAPAILGFVNFKPGHTYADFREGSHRLASYGLAGLVAGGIGLKAGAKVGLLKGLLPLLLGAKKLLIGLGIAALAVLKKLFGKKKPEIRTAV